MGRRRDPSAAIPSDEHRCTRNDGKSWRCYFPRFGANSYCHKHHLAYLSKLTHPPPQNPNPSPSNSRVFQPGQIWAFSQHPDRLPRQYARIDRKIPNQPSSVHVIPLLPHPVLEEEVHWTDDGGHTLACGTFRPSPQKPTAVVVMDTSALVFRVINFGIVNWMGIPFYRIFPNKDEVWAVCSKKEGEHNVVEVLSDFSEEEGVTVAGLVPGLGSDGGVCYHRRLHEGFQLVQTFGRREMVMFSHRILASRVEGEHEGGGGGGGGGDTQMWKVF